MLPTAAFRFGCAILFRLSLGRKSNGGYVRRSKPGQARCFSYQRNKFARTDSSRDTRASRMQMIAAPIPSQQAPPLTNTLPLNALLTGVRAKNRGASKLLTEPSRNSAKLHGIHHRPTRPS